MQSEAGLVGEDPRPVLIGCPICVNSPIRRVAGQANGATSVASSLSATALSLSAGALTMIIVPWVLREPHRPGAGVLQ